MLNFYLIISLAFLLGIKQFMFDAYANYGCFMLKVDCVLNPSAVDRMILKLPHSSL